MDNGGSVKLGHSDKHFVEYSRKKGPAEKNFEVFSLRYSYNYILNSKFKIRMDTTRAFFSKISALFFIFKKGQGRPPPPLP